MAISMESIKTLRESTGAGMMDCKKALEATNGDVEKAIDWLRENGVIKASKKASRIAAEGLCAISVCGNTAAIVEVNAETDFVAKNDLFKSLVKTVADLVAANAPVDMDAANAIQTEEGTIAELVIGATARIGEKISFRRFELVTKEDNQHFGTYIHSNGKIGVITLVDGADDESARDVAMHVAAMNPQFATRNDVPSDFVEKETHIQLEAAKQDPAFAAKPAQIQEKMISGRVNKVIAEICLVDQVFVKDPSLSVAKFLATKNGAVKSFTRYNVGEGMEKRVDNFAEEVMSQIK